MTHGRWRQCQHGKAMGEFIDHMQHTLTKRTGMNAQDRAAHANCEPRFFSPSPSHLLGSLRHALYISSAYTELEPFRKDSEAVDKPREATEKQGTQRRATAPSDCDASAEVTRSMATTPFLATLQTAAPPMKAAAVLALCCAVASASAPFSLWSPLQVSRYVVLGFDMDA